MKTPEAVYQAAFEGVGRLVPHEFAQLVLLGDAAPDAFGRTYGLRKLESRDIPSPYRENYPYYFKRTDMRITAIPYRPALFAASYAQFAGMEFGEEWCRPLKARWSAGFRSFDKSGRLSALLILYREGFSPPFKEAELDILEALQPHVRNLARQAQGKDQEAGLDDRQAERRRLALQLAQLYGLRLRVLTLGRTEFLEKLAPSLGELLRHLDQQLDVKVASPAALNGHAFFPYPKHPAMLGTGGHRDLYAFALDCGEG